MILPNIPALVLNERLRLQINVASAGWLEIR